MKMKWNTILLSMFLGLSVNANANTVMVYNEANLSVGHFWNVEVFNSNGMIGSFGGNWDTLRLGMKFPSTDFYKVSSIKYCTGELDKCLNEANFKSCFIQDNGNDDVDSNVDVHLLPDESCYAVKTFK